MAPVSPFRLFSLGLENPLHYNPHIISFLNNDQHHIFSLLWSTWPSNDLRNTVPLWKEGRELSISTHGDVKVVDSLVLLIVVLSIELVGLAAGPIAIRSTMMYSPVLDKPLDYLNFTNI